ncbi:hypothetical protein Dimus_023986, partial [Dionaea muscipula]
GKGWERSRVAGAISGDALVGGCMAGRGRLRKRGPRGKVPPASRGKGVGEVESGIVGECGSGDLPPIGCFAKGLSGGVRRPEWGADDESLVDNVIVIDSGESHSFLNALQKGCEEAIGREGIEIDSEVNLLA